MNITTFRNFTYNTLSNNQKINKSGIDYINAAEKKNSGCFYNPDTSKDLFFYNISFGSKSVSNPVYVIDFEGNYSRYDNKKAASEELSIPLSRIYSCSSEQQMTAGKYTFINADEVECECAGGLKNINVNKIIENYKKLQQKSVYSINNKGQYKKYESQKAASNQTGIPFDSIFQCVEGLNKTASGYIFVRAEEIEDINADGTISVNKEKLSKIISSRRPKRIYAILKDGSYIGFNNQHEAVKSLGVPASGVSQCITGKTKTSCGYSFVKASDVEDIDENGNISINKHKLKLYIS